MYANSKGLEVIQSLLSSLINTFFRGSWVVVVVVVMVVV
jgi:uncharacterized protein involved in exopolysaccharide biosynthesis